MRREWGRRGNGKREVVGSWGGGGERGRKHTMSNSSAVGLEPISCFVFMTDPHTDFQVDNLKYPESDTHKCFSQEIWKLEVVRQTTKITGRN